MDTRVIDEIRNDLLRRREISIIANTNGKTPSRKELEEELISKLGVDPKQLVIKRTRQSFGRNEILCFIRVYDDEQALQSFEPKPKVKQEAKK